MLQKVNGVQSEFKSVGVEQVPFTDTQTVKFRQYYRDIPVYGSVITVEMEQDNTLVSLNSSIGEPTNVDPQASISPKEALETVKKDANYSGYLDVTPNLYYYYHKITSRWRLAYVIKDVLAESDSQENEEVNSLPTYFDYIIDASNGEIIDKLPMTQTINRSPVTRNCQLRFEF